MTLTTTNPRDPILPAKLVQQVDKAIEVDQRADHYAGQALLSRIERMLREDDSPSYDHPPVVAA